MSETIKHNQVEFSLTFVQYSSYKSSYFRSSDRNVLQCFPTCSNSHGSEIQCVGKVILLLEMTTYIYRNSKVLPSTNGIKFPDHIRIVGEFHIEDSSPSIVNPISGLALKKLILETSSESNRSFFVGKVLKVLNETNSISLDGIFTKNIKSCFIDLNLNNNEWYYPWKCSTTPAEKVFHILTATVLVADRHIKSSITNNSNQNQPTHYFEGYENVNYYPVSNCHSPKFSVIPFPISNTLYEQGISKEIVSVKDGIINNSEEIIINSIINEEEPITILSNDTNESFLSNESIQLNSNNLKKRKSIGIDNNKNNNEIHIFNNFDLNQNKIINNGTINKTSAIEKALELIECHSTPSVKNKEFALFLQLPHVNVS